MKTWFITGASRGFGARFVREALDRGDNVVAAARNPEAVIKLFGDRDNLLAVPLDVTSEAQAKQAVDAAVQRFGQIDVLVNNAGFGVIGAIEEISGAEVEAVYKTNVFGLLTVTRAVLPQMRKQRSGHILNISSIGGYRSWAAWGVYASTKFAVEGISEALAMEVEPLGIKVTVVEPGYFRTDFLDTNSLNTTSNMIGDYAQTVGEIRKHAASLNHQQPGDPDRLAKALLKVVDAANPPLRMPFGSDTVAAIEAKNAFVAAELDTWRELAMSTDFPN
ncbi:SDR family NAD(P)-dependent oxidoreductase [Rhizobium sp. P38BS-XIX]|uniref:oxidoreductase n=1 Tax=Rhizobium sp. P38BS-XIX TaxID=2726740 RepID=UPI0014568FB2|nr:oxidoreductase [Rhizobium sp. P38BS-XIX]NLS00116.1 SDR family NAD(P)-dependent oxidoreductase [Rhizobium sp. P38BS-XIX]